MFQLQENPLRNTPDIQGDPFCLLQVDLSTVEIRASDHFPV